ncbi:uncharacterized protein LOC131879924 isoform X3 [Tigriopus californicus]|uniref:uncharacterized protein LOC131879924 isoform X3 n=1 Tax=Tigriopus californicus TaxID=6832 RepID=UPI0027DA2089|nr:uncharacterized protein LOC131879924 isoform X3 [Tigriopus californicus]
MSSGGVSHSNTGTSSSHGPSGHPIALGGPTEKVPSLFIERPKMPRATWEALRAHVIKERQKKKQMLDKTQEVLYEDDRRRSKDVSHSNIYMQQPIQRPTTGIQYMKPHHPHMLLAPTISQVNAASAMNQPQNLATLKRQRSPSPPRSTISTAYYRTPALSSTANKHNLHASAVNSLSAASIYGSSPSYPSGCTRDDSERTRPQQTLYLSAADLSHRNACTTAGMTVARSEPNLSTVHLLAASDRGVREAQPLQLTRAGPGHSVGGINSSNIETYRSSLLAGLHQRQAPAGVRYSITSASNVPAATLLTTSTGQRLSSIPPQNGVAAEITRVYRDV